MINPYTWPAPFSYRSVRFFNEVPPRMSSYEVERQDIEQQYEGIWRYDVTFILDENQQFGK